MLDRMSRLCLKIRMYPQQLGLRTSIVSEDAGDRLIVELIRLIDAEIRVVIIELKQAIGAATNRVVPPPALRKSLYEALNGNRRHPDFTSDSCGAPSNAV